MSIKDSSLVRSEQQRSIAQDFIRRAMGIDKLWYIVNGNFVRNVEVDGMKHYSIVDVVAALSSTPNPRRYWSDKKRAIIGANSELYENIVQLKLKAEDGKSYLTDTVSLWGLLSILSRLDTPESNALMNAMFKGIANGIDNAQFRYHAMNMERGIGWAQTVIHEQMKQLAPPDKDDVMTDLGY